VAQDFLQGCVIGIYLVVRAGDWGSIIGGEDVQDTLRGTGIGRNEIKMEAGEGRRASSL
jgi:hypothetical protein